jgi:quercetin dioxygenase-like cupin family protein
MNTTDLRQRVARFAELKFSSHAHLDTYLPGNAREICPVIGPGVLEDPALKPPIAADGFNVTYVKCAPGNGNALHDHPTVEVFIPMTGKWSFRWGANGEDEVVLGPWDVISIPPGIERQFRNVGGEDAHMMAILGGSDAGKVIWSKRVLDEARKRGLDLDKEGYVVER